MAKLRIYVDPTSGNCLKTKWTADYLGIEYDWVELDILAGAARREDFLKINPAGQVPAAVLPDGRALTQSNAIIVYLAEIGGRDLWPDDLFERANVLKWLFWEQNSHEPYIAGRRFRKVYLKHTDSQIDAEWLPRGKAALALMEGALGKADFIAGDGMSLADIALLAYTRVAAQGGFDLAGYPAVREWIIRIERILGIEPAKDV